jgi:hypothetical protein
MLITAHKSVLRFVETVSIDNVLIRSETASTIVIATVNDQLRSYQESKMMLW